MSYTALYIANTDITDSIARDFITNSDSRLDTWMRNTDDEIKALALSLGVSIESIVTPVNYRIKEYAIAYYCFALFQDCYGENEVEDNANDIYKIKLEWYANRVNALRGLISKEMFFYEATANIPASSMVANTGIIWVA